MEIEIVIRGDLTELADVLAQIDQRTRTYPEKSVNPDLEGFVRECTPPMLRVVNEIITASLTDTAISRDAIALHAQMNEGDLNGAFGNISKAWKRMVGTRNPFASFSGPRGVSYQIDRDLASQLAIPAAERLTSFENESR